MRRRECSGGSIIGNDGELARNDLEVVPDVGGFPDDDRPVQDGVHGQMRLSPREPRREVVERTYSRGSEDEGVDASLEGFAIATLKNG